MDVLMRVAVTLVLSVTMSGCVGFTSLDDSYQAAAISQPAMSQKRHSLLQIYQRYQGTPYRYGGTTASGFDCSGFIQTVYREAYGFSTPRTTEQLARSGKPIRRDQLRAGDILIFRTSIKHLHAGVYIGNNQFIHASTSQGVVQSSLDNHYWLRHFIKARRYL